MQTLAPQTFSQRRVHPTTGQLRMSDQLGSKGQQGVRNPKPQNPPDEADAGVCMGPGGQDKDLIYQAHTGTTVLDALRCVPLGTAPRHPPHSTPAAVLCPSAASLHRPLE